MLFPVIALVVGALLVGVAVLFVRNLLADRPPVGTQPVPATVLQRLSLWALLVGALVVAAEAWFLTHHGPVAVYDDDNLRMVFTAILLVGIVLFSGYFVFIQVSLTRRHKLDERDLSVLARAPVVQGALMLITLAAWDIGLQETFRGTPGVPVTYIHLMFWSALAANMLAWPLGILIGYRRS